MNPIRTVLILFLSGIGIAISTERAALADSVRPLADLNAGSVGSYPSNFTAYAGAVFFSAYTFDTGRELWRFDGTNVILVKDINDTADDIGFGFLEGNDSTPSELAIYNGELYFSAFDPYRGGELWRFNGSTASRVADISPDANDAIKMFPNSSWPQYLTIFNNTLYFSANSGTLRENYELWKYDGINTQQVANLHPDIGTNQSSFPKELTVFNGALYFTADDGPNGFELWKYDGLQTMLLNVNAGDSNSSSYPKYLTGYNNRLYFQAYTPTNGYELWQTDGTSVSLAADINAGSEGSFPTELTVFNGILCFGASDPAHGAELWKYDGTKATLAADINPSGDSFAKNLRVFGDQLVFSADDGVHGWELWKFDGTNATMITDLNPSGDSFPESLTVVGDTLYFVATTPDTGYELFKYDGNSVTPVTDINPGPGNSYPQYLAAVNGQLFFSAAEDGTSNWEPWVLTPGETSASVTITAPSSGAVFQTSDSITIDAVTTGAITQVEFFANGNSVGVDNTAPYGTSTTLAPGSWSLTAVATENNGATITSAAVNITVAEPNSPPSVSLTSPSSGAVFLTTDSVTLSADTADDGSISKVEFFANGISVGEDSAAPYSISTTFSAGSWSLTAKATDNLGSSTASAPIDITIQGPANQPPTVTLSSDQAGQTLSAPATVTLVAAPTDSDGTINRVEFFSGGNSVGAITAAPWQLTLNNLAAGNYSFTAKATDDDNIEAASNAILVTVVNQTQPEISSVAKNGGNIEITASTTPGINYILQKTADFKSWAGVSTNMATSSSTTFSDTLTGPHYFYRIAE